MSNVDPKLVVLQFNQCINNRDLDGLARLMTEDHTLIDSSDEVHSGKELMEAGWREFFISYPDYCNHFLMLESRENLVLIIGHSTCSHDALDGPALWTARVEGGLVAEWRVYLDTAETRKLLRLPQQDSISSSG